MKTVLVTGGSGGIGQAIVQAFAEKKYHVIIHYNRSKDKAEALKIRLEKVGLTVDIIQGDLLNPSSLDAMMHELSKRQLVVDVLINNAGLKNDNPIDAMPDDDFIRVMQVNTEGPWKLMKRLVPSMKKQGYGRIVNITSGVAKEGRANQTNYAASKAALENLTLSLGKELGPFGITVNAVAPGLIETPMTEDVDQDTKEAYIKRVPIGRLVKAEDVAHACLFFADEKSGSISGQIVGVNGGLR